MSGSVPQVQCGACGATINEPQDLSPGKRTPCPACGSTTRKFSVFITETLTLRESLGFKAKRQGQGKPYVEGRSGDDLHRKTGKWMKKEQVIDRENDQYAEVVTDPETGIVMHHCKEPLSKHRGHGSAKKAKP